MLSNYYLWHFFFVFDDFFFNECGQKKKNGTNVFGE